MLGVPRTKTEGSCTSRFGCLSWLLFQVYQYKVARIFCKVKTTTGSKGNLRAVYMKGGRSWHPENPRRRISLAPYAFCISSQARVALFPSVRIFSVLSSSKLRGNRIILNRTIKPRKILRNEKILAPCKLLSLGKS